MDANERYFYFQLDNTPCRVSKPPGGDWGEAEMYVSGEGFVPGHLMEILNHGTRLSKDAFQAMIVALTRRPKGEE